MKRINFLYVIQNNIFIILIIIIASILRFWNYDSFSLTNDELSALNRIRYDSVSDMLKGGVWVDGHPAGVQVFLYYWTSLFGISETYVRLPFVICSILAIYFAYKAAYSWFGRGAGLFVAICISFLEFPLLYSNIARPYSVGLMFVMLLAWKWKEVLIIVNNKQFKQQFIDAICLCLAITGSLYTHYFAALMACIAGITGLVFLNKKNYKFFIGAYLISALFYLIHINYTLNHIKLGGVGQWLNLPDDYWFFNHIYTFFNEDIILLLFIIATCIWAYQVSKPKLQNQSYFKTLQIISLIWTFIPFVIGYSYSYIINPVLQNSVLLFSTPFLLFFGGSFWNNKINLPHKLMLIILGSVILISTVFINKHYKKTHFTDFKGAAFKIKHIEKIYGENNICKVFNINDPYYIMYYIGNDTLGVKKWYIQTENDFKELANIVDNCNKSFFMYVRLRPSNNIINDIINARYPYLIEYQKFDNYSDVYLYSKVLLKSSYNNEAPQMVFGNGFEGNNRWKGELMFVDTICYKGALGLKLKPQDEYSPTWSVNIDTLPVLKKIKYIKAETYVLSGKAGDLQLVISVEDNEGRLVKWSSCKFDYFVTPNKWSKIIHTVNVTLNKGEIIKVYIWNPSGEKAYIDDFSISIY